MKASILCGGSGERMQPITDRIPKPLIPLLNKPTIDYIIRKIPKNVKQIVIHVSHMSDFIINYVKSSDYDYNIVFVHDDKPPGTGGAIRSAMKYLDEPFFLLCSDVISSIDLLELKKFHDSKKALLTIACIEVSDPTEFGNVRIDSDQRIIDYKEKPARDEIISNLASGGTFFMNPEIFDYFPRKDALSLEKELYLERDILPELIGEEMYAYIISDYCIDVGTLSRYLEATKLLLDRDQSISERFSEMRKRLRRQGVKIMKPVCLGSQNIIEKNVEIGPNVAIGDSNYIMEGTKIKDSVVFDRCIIGKNVTIKNSIVDSGSNMKNGRSVKSTIFSPSVCKSDLRCL